jgi:autotransporter-associated beta strand protein
MRPTDDPCRTRPNRAAALSPTSAALAAALIVLASPGVAPAQTSTYTGPGSGNFSNIQNWNFGGGPVPVSGSDTVLNFLSYGGGGYTATLDLPMTLGTLQLSTFGRSGITLTGGTNYAFTGAAQVQLLGSGGLTTLNAPVTLGSGTTGLSFTGSGSSGLTLAGPISSSTEAGAPLTIATTPGAANVGVVTLSGSNTFAGGVVLNSGSLAIGNSQALGAPSNTLTVNGGSFQFSGATPAVVNNNVVLNSTLNYTNTTNNQLTLSGVLSGPGGVNYATGVGSFLNLQGINTYTGATTIAMVPFAGVSGAQAGTIRVQGAVGSILNTSSISVRDGGTFEVNLNAGNSLTNARVSASAPITVANGFLQVVNSNAGGGFVSQSFGTVTGSGSTTILANANNATGPPTTVVTIADLVRSGSGTFVFTGNGIGTLAPTPGNQVGAIFLNQVNGAAPGAALVGGGGGANTSTISILPWAVGDVSGAGSNFGAGTGLVTYDAALGVRLLNATTEYNTSNNFNTANPADNMRVTAAAALTGNATVNAVFNTGAFNISGTGLTLTVTSGALAQATGTSSTVSANLSFGAGGAGEGVVTVIGGLGATNTLTVSGGLTAGSLTKAGQGTLVLTGANAIAGGITVNGGFISVPAVSNLGGATGLTFSMPTFTSSGGLVYSGTGTDTLSVPIAVTSGHAQFNVSSATGVLNLNSNISGVGGINPQGTGTLVLGGTNTFTGGMRIGGGTLVFDSDARLGDPGGFITVNGGSIRLTGSWTTARPRWRRSRWCRG